MQTVHVRITDAATGKPTPCRVHFVGPDGTYYAPLGRLRNFPGDDSDEVGGNLMQGKKRYAYIDGSCEIVLPSGEVAIEVHKGPEYVPILQTVLLKPGQISLRLRIERWADLRSEGWFSGDTHVSMTPHAALLEGAAEDLAVVNVLASERGDPPRISHLLAFSGQKPALETPGYMVVVNTLNTDLGLGALGLLNCHRVVYPLRLGGHGGLSGYTLTDWCDQCHRKGGLVVWCSFQPDADGEALADAILGKVDAAALSMWPEESQEWQRHWYDLLNCGVRLPMVAGSAKWSNRRKLGEPRTYARLKPGEEFSYRSWIEAVRAGRVFVTKGPLLSFAVNGQDPGSVLELPSAGDVHVRAEARGREPFGTLEVVWNGRVIAAAEAVFDGPASVTESGWLAVRCAGAHASPVYVRVGSHPMRVDLDSHGRVLKQLENTLRWVEDKPDWENERQKQHLIETFQNARQVLLQRCP